MIAFKIKQHAGDAIVFYREVKFLWWNSCVACTGNAAHDKFAFIRFENVSLLWKLLQCAGTVSFTIGIVILPVHKKWKNNQNDEGAPYQNFFHEIGFNAKVWLIIKNSPIPGSVEC